MKRMRKGIGFFTIVGSLLLTGFSALAQPAVEMKHSFGCSSTDAESTFTAELNHPSKLQLLHVTDEKEIGQAKTDALHVLFDQIDSKKYGNSRVDFYVHQKHPAEPSNLAPYSALTIYVAVTSGNQSLWWKVVESQSANPELTSENSLLFAQVPNSDDEPSQPPVVITTATGDTTRPIFDLTWNYWLGGVSTEEKEVHLMLDLRIPEPHVAADLSCNSITAFGACGVYDAQTQSRNNYECDWVESDNDFRCEGIIWNGELTERQTKSWFELLSGKPSPFSVAPGNPVNLGQFALLAEHDPSRRTRQPELPGFGKVSHLARLALSGGRVVHIFGTYGSESPFGAYFYQVTVGENATSKVAQIVSRSPYGNYVDDVFTSEDEPQTPATDENAAVSANQIETGTNLGFSVKEMFLSGRTHIYQITARERLHETKHAVYWLGVEDAADGTKFGIVKIASDTGHYAGCAHYMTEASAAVITPEKGQQFRALIDAEPPHKSGIVSEGFIPPDVENGENAEDECPYTIHVEWSDGKWVADQPALRCTQNFSPRWITISDDGRITAKPAKIATDSN